jgi:hypothetical protein
MFTKLPIPMETIALAPAAEAGFGDLPAFFLEDFLPDAILDPG